MYFVSSNSFFVKAIIFLNGRGFLSGEGGNTGSGATSLVSEGYLFIVYYRLFQTRGLFRAAHGPTTIASAGVIQATQSVPLVQSESLDVESKSLRHRNHTSTKTFKTLSSF